MLLQLVWFLKCRGMRLKKILELFGLSRSGFYYRSKREEDFGFNPACEEVCIGESGIWVPKDMGIIEARGS